MNIEVIVAGKDEQYVKRLYSIMKNKKFNIGDTPEVSLFTDADKLTFFLNNDVNSGAVKQKRRIVLIDKHMGEENISYLGASSVVMLTDDSEHDGKFYPATQRKNCLHIYKYQRVSSIVDKLIDSLAIVSEDTVESTKRSSAVYAFFSPKGGSGTSTLASSYAVKLANEGIKTLFVSFEKFNSTELFFGGSNESERGLSGVFSIVSNAIFNDEDTVKTIGAAKTKHKTGVEFLRRFALWTDIFKIKDEDMKKFINCARIYVGAGAVVLDLGSAYEPFTNTAFDNADEIFVVANRTTGSSIKLNAMFSDKTFIEEGFLEKVSLIYNGADKEPITDKFKVKAAHSIKELKADSVSELIEAVSNELGKALPYGFNS